MPTSKQVSNDPAVHITVPAAGKDATPINFQSAETGSGEGSASTSVNQNALASSSTSSAAKAAPTQATVVPGLSFRNPA